MARPKSKAPARRCHISGQSVVTIAGRDIYLGKHDSPESLAGYAVLIGIYQSGGMTLPEDFDPAVLDEQAACLAGRVSPSIEVSDQSSEPILVRHVTALFREHCKTKYRNTPQEKHRHDRICDQIDDFAGDLPAEQFGPVKLKQFRENLVAEKLARKYVNRLVNCVVTIFRNAVAGELIDVSVVLQMESLESLRCGQTEAHETEEVQPANLAHVRATAEHLSPIVKTMLRIQVATGKRSSGQRRKPECRSGIPINCGI